MTTSYSRTLLTLALCGCLSSCANAQPNTQPIATAKIPLRTLIVSGGPNPDSNQYAIESNARYLENLTSRATSQRILFADGSKKSRTIATLQPAPDADENLVFAWIFEEDAPEDKTVYRASTLKRIDGPSTEKSVLTSAAQLAAQVKTGERGLVYFTGHGSTGNDKVGAFFGGQLGKDLDNTTYGLWNGGEVSVKELAGALQKWPQDVPLVLVMVQCHSGGFTNVMFEGGDPKKPIWERDFAGFFAATAEREASGCTSEVDERDYQDFTTHFFAALSGRSRDGRVISGADYDRNGAVSMLEAYAWANLYDASSDVPVCTSDAYLRHIFSNKEEPQWMQTPYSTLLASANPWQKAMLNGLSQRLGLKGEKRILAATAAHRSAKTYLDSGQESDMPDFIATKQLKQRFYTTKAALRRKFPGLKAPASSTRYATARRSAIAWLKTRPADVQLIARALRQWEEVGNRTLVREAMLWRFLRVSRTIVLQKRLAQSGTPAQKATFARLRTSESRNPLLP